MGTGLRVRKGVVVLCERESAGGRHGRKPVIGQTVAEMPAGGGERVIERIVRIVHPIDSEGSFQAALVETGVMRDKGEISHERLDPFPYIGEYGGVLRIFRAEPVNPPAKPLVIVRLGMDKAVKGI